MVNLFSWECLQSFKYFSYKYHYKEITKILSFHKVSLHYVEEGKGDSKYDLLPFKEKQVPYYHRYVRWKVIA